MQYNSEVDATIPAGMFCIIMIFVACWLSLIGIATADLLMESRLTNGRTGNQFLSTYLTA